MSQENVEKLRPVYREWARGNLRAGRELFAPDVRYEAEAPGQGPVIGTEAIENQMREFLAQWSEFRIEAEAFEARALQHEIDHCDGLLFLDRAAGAHAVYARKTYL